MQNTNRPVLTKPAYWNSIQPATRAYWQALANALPYLTVCTHRPSVNLFGKPFPMDRDIKIRRCSTGGKFGKSVDKVWLNEAALKLDGFVFRTYIPAKIALADKREAVYSNDNH